MTAPATSRIIPKTNSPAETMTVRAAIGSPHLRGGRTRPASGPTRARPGTEDQPQVGTPDGVPQQVRKERLDPVRSEARQERTDVDPEPNGEGGRENRPHEERHPTGRPAHPPRPPPARPVHLAHACLHPGC